ncbi:Fe-S cluster assembly protein SufD [Bdellovibrio svalbardensis]|uniref:Fe-S cluster assembly protein SufD n=1 Tax=Bdellovibrio svalbardensis TaxID=2972972 RepID=A0ABT6DER5_9BACT|nr:Fe-S cluster assembly protein SufD [Bdellovibrio svalbardensis]MDG0814775.1 Fe-S cluster assembly protein SufD [Bdellovibrio svalbardensis]
MNLLSAYEKFNQAHPAQGALASYRQAAFDYASKKGLPTRKDEDWHYTSVKVLGEKEFTPSAVNPMEPSHETLLEIKKILNPDFVNVVFFNGVLNRTLSNDLPTGFTLRELSEYPAMFHDTFDALNGAYMTKPFALNVTKETSVEKPVNFVFFTSSEGGPALMIHPRIRLDVGTRSSVKVLESHYGQGAAYFVNSVFDLHVADSATVTYARIQAENDSAINIGRTRITLGKNANLQSLVLATGASLSRHSLEVLLKGHGANADVLGVYAVKGSQHADNTTVIDHQVGECNTNQLYKGILDDESKAVFCGKVLIQKDAQKANSAQLNNNLLLSSKAEADSKPSLEIYADDVKAAHGSTVGQLNREELFYLLSRAIPKDKAMQMLSYGFLSEVIYKISDEDIQKWLSRHLDEAFKRLHVESLK